MAPRRITPLLVTNDLAGQSNLYRELGFVQVSTDDLACVGFIAGETGIILEDAQFASICYGASLAERLQDQAVPYVYVDEIAATSIPALHSVAADLRTPYG